MASYTVQLESSRTSALLRLLNSAWGGRAFFAKIHGSPFQPRLVDILGCFSGLFVALEVKRPGNKPTPRQLKTMDQIKRAGGIAEVIWSNEDAKKVLDSIGNRVYLGITNPASSTSRAQEKEKQIMPSAKSKSAKAGKSASANNLPKVGKKSAPAVEEDEDEELEDLDDLDELDDDDFEDEEEEEDEEDEPVPVKSSKKAKNDAVAAKSKASKQPSPVTTKKGIGKKSASAEKPQRGNIGNLSIRKLPEGRAGAQHLAEALGIDARATRVLLRKQSEVKGDDGLYDFGKVDSKEFRAVVKKYKPLVTA